MDPDVPYLGSISNVPRILDQVQRAGVPETFNRDFLRDLGFTSSNDRPIVKVLKYLGLLDASGKPQAAYRDFVDHTKARKVLAARLRAAYDDLFLADRQADAKSAGHLKGWFKSKTGAGEAVAEKMASTFKALAQYADFAAPAQEASPIPEPPRIPREPPSEEEAPAPPRPKTVGDAPGIGFVYRIEIHLPDTQNVETFRAIFRAIREELM